MPVESAYVDSWDHPRAYGEHGWRRAEEPAGKGPSPRMRGALALAAQRAEHAGTIPAHAGSTRSG